MTQAKESTKLLRYRDLSFSQKFNLYLAIFSLSEHLDSKTKKPDSAPKVVWPKQKAVASVERRLLMKFLFKPWSFLGELTWKRRSVRK